MSWRPKLLLPSEPSRSLQRFEAEKIDGLVGDFEARFGLAFLRLADLAARACLTAAA